MATKKHLKKNKKQTKIGLRRGKHLGSTKTLFGPIDSHLMK